MKLINKTISYYLLISVPLLVLAGVYAYFQLKAELREEADESLVQEAFHAQGSVDEFGDSTVIYLDFNHNSSIRIVEPHKDGYKFSDTLMYGEFEEEIVPYRMLKTYSTYNGKTYLITVVKATLEEEDLFGSLFYTFILIMLFLILAFFLVSWLVVKRLWKPFYHTLSKLNSYDIKQHDSSSFERTSTKEFDQLNLALNKMTDKLYSDFIQQKEFTENASHEMQTPLAVIKANISLLMQSPHLQSEEMNQVQSIDDTVKKLTSLNKALLLLAKIENNQFNEITKVDIGTIFNKITQHFQDLLEAKQIMMEINLPEPLYASMNPALAEILLTNLLQNAIRHNFKGGLIRIETSGNQLIISNTGEQLTVNEQELFTRFKKNEASKESLGLGLAIVRSICDLYEIQISYNYGAMMHHFSLKFKN